MGVLVFITVFILNYGPIINSYPQLQPIRSAINPSIPIIAAVIIGIFAQGVGLMYKLLENAITNHLTELNNIARELLNNIKDVNVKSVAYFSDRSSGTYEGPSKLYVHIESPLCRSYKRVSAKYNKLLDDIGCHWREAGESLKKLKSLCARIKEHCRNVEGLEQEIKEELKDLIGDEVATKLPGVNVGRLRSYLYSAICKLVRRVIECQEKFADISYSRMEEICKSMWESCPPEETEHGLLVGGYYIGNVRKQYWTARGEPLVVKAIHKLFSRYGDRLDELADEGREIISEAQDILENLRKSLRDVAEAKFLPLTKVCNYLS